MITELGIGTRTQKVEIPDQNLQEILLPNQVEIGLRGEEEVKRAEKAVKILGGSFFHCHDAGSTENGHVLLEFKKVSDTPARYPRKAGIPTKKPIL